MIARNTTEEKKYREKPSINTETPAVAKRATDPYVEKQ